MDTAKPAGVSRRSLLGVAGGALIGAMVTRAPSARAASGDPLILGEGNHAEQPTSLTGGRGIILRLRATRARTALYVGSSSVQGTGISAQANAVGVLGATADGVGVKGVTNGVGYGLQGVAPEEGVALQAKGRVEFSSAGVAVIPHGEQFVDVGLNEHDNTLCVATVQSEGGVLKGALHDVDGQFFRLTLIQPATQDVTIAYFLVDAV